MMNTPSPQDILDFWYTAEMRAKWFASTLQIDAMIRERYASVWESASSGALEHWRDSAAGCLALVIILDQLPLNMFRGTAQSFSTEQQAVAITKHAIDKGFDQQIDKSQLAFLYMPLMHSENMADQDLSVALYETAGLGNNARFARHHREIVRRFGRFPHRNAILGRANTPQEIDYLNSKEAFKG